MFRPVLDGDPGFRHEGEETVLHAGDGLNFHASHPRTCREAGAANTGAVAVATPPRLQIPLASNAGAAGRVTRSSGILASGRVSGSDLK
ncbi:MAG: hypothetical protein ACOYX1_02720 [Acidobacteriota bacterium]